MDNASFHHSDKIKEMCSEAAVKLLYLPPYSPEPNPIEEFFSELKSYIKRNWKLYEDEPELGFDTFLQACIDTVSARKARAEAHFRHSAVTIEEFGNEFMKQLYVLVASYSFATIFREVVYLQDIRLDRFCSLYLKTIEDIGGLKTEFD